MDVGKNMVQCSSGFTYDTNFMKTINFDKIWNVLVQTWPDYS